MVHKSLSIIISLMVSFISCLALIDFASMLDQKLDINQTTRRYLLKMEADGYMTDDDRTEFLNELARLGVTGVSLTGTTFTDAGYGNDVVLQFTGRLHYTGVRLVSLVEAYSEAMTDTIHERIISTAKN